MCLDKCPGQCNQKCNDTETGYKCFCKPGFNLTSFYKCEDIDECTTTKPCHSSEVCLNLEGSYSCSCPSGFEKDAKNVCVGKMFTYLCFGIFFDNAQFNCVPSVCFAFFSKIILKDFSDFMHELEAHKSKKVIEPFKKKRVD